MKVYLIYILLFLTLSASKCKSPAMDYDYPLYLKNTSNRNVNIYFNQNESYIYIYPDTSITNFRTRVRASIKPNTLIDIAGGSAPWEKIFEVRVPNDTMSIFVIDSDTLNNHPWDTIRSQYLILQRYDLSLKDLENRKFEIEYPYDPSRGKLKVWKP